jgi:hypothetical protein
MMGVHWTDTLAAEFHGHPFDETFIYGFYHGKMVFVEPMITRALLASHPDVTAPVKQPRAFNAAGFTRARTACATMRAVRPFASRWTRLSRDPAAEPASANAHTDSDEPTPS